jgi:predicted trehalose synthase
MATECPQCGARFESDETCEGWFQATQLIEFEQPAYYAVHHLSVPAFMLQHNRYSREGWVCTRQLLAQFVGGDLTPGEALRHTRSMLAGGRRTWSFTRGPRLAEVEQIVWTRTVADVRADTPEHYCADVRAWAAAVLVDTAALIQTLNRGV